MALGAVLRAIFFGAAASTLTIGSASAETLYSTSFCCTYSNIVGDNWTEVERNLDDVAIVNSYVSGHAYVMQLRDYRAPDTGLGGVGPIDASATQQGPGSAGFDATNLINITLSFQWKGYRTEGSIPGPGDKLYVEWRLLSDPNNWINLAVIALTPLSTFTDAGPLQLVGANGKTDIQFRFWTDLNEPDYDRYCNYLGQGGKTCDTAKIDNVLLVGDKRPDEELPPVPIPGALPLFVSGLALFGGLVYRRKRKVNAAA